MTPGASGRLTARGAGASQEATGPDPGGGVNSTRHDHDPPVTPGMLTSVARVPAVRNPDRVARVMNGPSEPVGRARIRADPFDGHVVGMVQVNVARSGDESATDDAVQAVPTAPAEGTPMPTTAATAAAIAMGVRTREDTQPSWWATPPNGGGARPRLPLQSEVLTKRS